MTATSTDVVLRVTGLSKSYHVYSRPLDLLLETFTGRSRHREFWALRDINFSMRRGEIIGVIGSNGAGKSTLLRIVAGTLDRTDGDIAINGRLSAILELGTSFNPEYSGRENVRLALIYAGMRGSTLESRMHEAIEFSEIESVIDQPFKTYSSGMKARLTFSTALATRTDLLIIDEALAAGDAHFVAKCIRFLSQICRSENVSALLVSHGMSTLMKLCNRGLYLRKGQLVMDGAIRDVVNEYEKTVLIEDEELLHARRGTATTLVASQKVRIIDAYTASDGARVPVLLVGRNAQIVVAIESDETLADVCVCVEIYSDLEGAFVTTLSNITCRSGDLRSSLRMPISIARRRVDIVFECDPLLLGAGAYFYHFSLFSSENLLQGRMNYGDAILHQRYVGQFRVKQEQKMYFEATRLIEHPLRVSARECVDG